MWKKSRVEMTSRLLNPLPLQEEAHRMEDFVVSARKYRPKRFNEVVGQEGITETLLRSVEQNHLAQAFLFCGPRGVGKTTCARILARTVNEHSQENAAPDEDFAFNIFELDAASNNKVEDIRNLIDQVRIPPQVGKYKVYIIDEVHMLSSGAFNAFLKTLEEPPPYAIFILATTEKNKVLPTILSRCQVFDFSRIQVSDMVEHLRDIAQREEIEAEEQALHTIAEKADGGLRDALSIFDQLVSFTGNKLTYQDVIRSLNIVDHEFYFSITDSILDGNTTAVLLTLDEIIRKGFDPHHFINGLAEHFRKLMLSSDPETGRMMEVGDHLVPRYVDQSKRCDIRFLLNAMNLTSETDLQYKSSRKPRLLVELALLKLCKLSGKADFEKKNAENDDSEPIERANETGSLSNTSQRPADHSPRPEASETHEEIIAKPSQNGNREKEISQAEPIAPPKESKKAINSEVNEAAEGYPKMAAETNGPKPESAAEIQVKHGEEEQNEPRDKVEEAEKASAPSDSPIAEASLAQKHPEPAKPKTSAFSKRLGAKRQKGMVSLKDSMETKSALPKPDLENVPEGLNLSPLTGERPSKPFNLAQLWEVWDEYAAKVKEEDRQSYYATLTKRKPVVIEENLVELVLDNHVQLADLNHDKPQLLGFLRENLRNWKIDLRGVIQEEEDSEDVKLYTPEDRYKAMREINPRIELLRKQFDLDIEHDH